MISLARIHDRLGIQGDDAYLEQLEAGWVSTLESMTGRYLGEPKTVVDIRNGFARSLRLTEPEDGRRASVIFLSQPPANFAAVTKIETRTSISGDWEELDLETADVTPLPNFELDHTRLYRIDGSDYPAGARTVRVTYTAGYDIDNGPDMYEALLFDILAHVFRPEALRAKGGVASVSQRGVSVTWNDSSHLSVGLQDRIASLRERGGVV